MINFLKFKKLYYVISLFFLIPGFISLLKFGLAPGIDFSGGSLYEIEASAGKDLSEEGVKNLLTEVDTFDGVSLSTFQKSGENRYILRFSVITEEQKNVLKQKLIENFGEIVEVRFETIGPTVGRELIIKTIVAIVLASLAIVAFIAFVFHEGLYGISAVLAMFHDTLIVLGVFSLLGHFYQVEVDVLFVAAVLTILSFSVHDTIVVFDRIRENLKRNPHSDFDTVANEAITETMVRSLNNSLTIVFMLLALFFLGGTTIRWFVFALLVGTIAGTYSSTFTAIPLLSTLQRFKKG